MIVQVPRSVRSDFDGYSFLSDLCESTSELFFEELTLDFHGTTWFEANLLAVLGAVLNKLETELNTVSLVNLNQQLTKLFQRNQFLSHFGGFKLQDFYKTTIRYTKFKSSEERLFKHYLDNELLSKRAMPRMSAQLRKKINESIFEIFNNAVIHGGCTHIFSCGQYYPNKARLDFTLVDLGATIKRNVSQYLQEECTGTEAIEWAVTENHTTRTGSIPGGLGLKLIREFVALNKGKIQIVSSDGYWAQVRKRTTSRLLPQKFLGTIVNLEFNIDDQNYYQLASEVTPENVF